MEAVKNRSIVKKIFFIYIPILIIAFALLSNTFIVKPNEYAVIKQFGKIVKVIEEDGLKIKVPLVQSVSKLPKHVLFYDVPATEINTFDKKRILVDYYTLWKITDPVQMLETLKTINAAEARLSDIMYSSVRNELGKLEYGEIINPADNNRGSIDLVVQDNINAILKSNLNGIEIVDIQMKRIDLPQSNEQSVYKRMISERASKAQEYLSQGDAEKTKIMANADREVAELIAKTNSQAKEIVAEGEKEAAKIYNDSYGQDVEFFKLYTTLNSYKTSIDGETVLMVPINSPYLKYFMGQ
ncbi:protease modulator HflC [Proteiniborus sp. MB09-C3]|uniref:protease modulator HflC n=1 Tax=Proteiniborus sp. MB09-C3 TaxID=3050072 RepID=UPI002553B60D|nr:protease modulator HflC [Proteiniborus sp. MB09-C3]WIV11783.1 protease modulator HflC [Proteiniborus sp. MB09-C3]